MKSALPRNGTVEELKRRLLDRRREARHGLAAHVVDYGERPSRVAEEDQAPLSHEEYITQALNRMDWQTLREVDQALERIDKGEYGVCEECGDPISIKRLNAVPWARRCLECQESRSFDEAEVWSEALQ